MQTLMKVAILSNEVNCDKDLIENAVLALLIVNIDNLPVGLYDEIFKAVGLDVRSFKPPSIPLPAASWPTLGAMIDSNQRLVTFMDNGADGSVPYILDGMLLDFLPDIKIYVEFG